MEEAPPTEIDEQEVQQEVPEEVQEETPVENPTKDVKTFWNRLDEVLTELESERPIVTRPYTSSLFQPERISISSANAIPSYPVSGLEVGTNFYQLHQNAETFNQFTVKFQKSLINVKSLQCLSCIIPNISLNIPDDQTFFYYYKIPSLLESSEGEWDEVTVYNRGDVVEDAGDYYVSLSDENLGIDPIDDIPGAWYDISGQTNRPNYYRLEPNYIESVNLLPSVGLPPEWAASPQSLKYNRSFTSYQDLVDSLNACAAAAPTATIPGDVSFQYNETLNKIVLVPSDTANYYYMAVGFTDPNLVELQEASAQQSQKTLNLRCGFTWNGAFPSPFTLSNPFTSDSLYEALLWYLRPSDPIFADPLYYNINYSSLQPIQIANSYGNLVNTSCVKVYCNITMGSTQDSNGEAGLLSVVPMNAANLAVGYYQNNFNNPLTKVPDIISEIEIRLVTESGQPFYLPNSAVVTLELYVLYK